MITYQRQQGCTTPICRLAKRIRFPSMKYWHQVVQILCFRIKFLANRPIYYKLIAEWREPMLDTLLITNSQNFFLKPEKSCGISITPLSTSLKCLHRTFWPKSSNWKEFTLIHLEFCFPLECPTFHSLPVVNFSSRPVKLHSQPLISPYLKLRL